MIHCVSSRLDFSRRVKESKRAYLNLKSNENLVSDSEAIVNFFLEDTDPVELLKYPVFDDAYAAFQSHLGVDNLVLTAGCHDAIRVLASSLDKDKNKVFLSTPNYDGYSLYLDINEIKYITHHRTPQKQHCLPELTERAVATSCNLIVLTNPDPFVGDCFTRDQICDLLDHCHSLDISVVIDEVYAGFGRESDVRLTERFSNLIVLNSFSKSYGLPGARVGWIAGSEQNIESLGCQFSESTISGFSLALCKKLLEAPYVYESYRQLVIDNRKHMVTQLSDINGLELTFEGVANFVLFKAIKERQSSQLWQELLDRGIYLANLNHIKGFDNYYRATVCPADIRGDLIESIKQF